MQPLPSSIKETVVLEVSELKTRIISGAVFVVLLAAVFLVAPPIVATVAVALMAAIASYELLYTTGLVKQIRLNIYSALMAAAIALSSHFSKIFISSTFGTYNFLLLMVLLYWMLLFGEVLLSSGKLPVAQIGYCLMAGVVVPLLLSALARIRLWPDSTKYILIPFIMAYFSDTGAYFVGVFFGKHKMCPNISPKKSWEGFFGGILTAVLGMILYCWILDISDYRVNYVFAVLYGLVGSIGSVFGDLLMSAIKRQTGIKDYGKLIPGHGGILDRFDSVLITAPLTEALLLLIPMVV